MNITQRILLFLSIAVIVSISISYNIRAGESSPPVETFNAQKNVICGEVGIISSALEKYAKEEIMMKIQTHNGTDIWIYFATNNTNTITILETDGTSACLLGTGVVITKQTPRKYNPKSDRNKT